MAVERESHHWVVKVPLMEQAKKADDDFWVSYMDDIHPDDRHHMPYHRYLAKRLKDALEINKKDRSDDSE